MSNSEIYYVFGRLTPDLEIPSHLAQQQAVDLYQARWDALQPLCRDVEAIGIAEKDYMALPGAFFVRTELTSEQQKQIRGNQRVERILNSLEYYREFVKPLN